MNMAGGGNAKHNHHQTPVYRAVSYKSAFWINLAGVFTHKHVTVEHRLGRQQRQTPVTDVGFVFGGVAGEFHTPYYADVCRFSASQLRCACPPSPVLERQYRCSSRSQALLGNAVREASASQPRSWSFQDDGFPSGAWEPAERRSLGTSTNQP